MRNASHERHLLTGSHALHALPGNEQGDFQKYLDRFPSSADEVRGLRETAARLGMATAISPPPEMRARVLAALPRTRQLPPGGRDSRTTAWRHLSLSRAASTTGILALAAAVAFLLVLQFSTSRQLRQAQDAGQAIAAVLNAPDARIEAMPVSVGGTVTAVVSLHDRAAVVTTAGLPRPSGSMVYQLWVISAAGAAKSAGLLDITSSGSAVPVLTPDVESGDRLGITIEPAGGTAKPTTTPVVVVPVSV